MRCRTVRKRLVAHRDGELAPSEGVRVEEHLASCSRCAALDRRLQHVTPRPLIDGESAWTPAMTRALDEAMDEAFEHPAPVPRPAWDRLRDRLADETRVPTAALWVYAALLLLAVGWGAQNWHTAQQLQVALDDVPAQRTADTGLPSTPTALPADQFRPAAWAPNEAGEGAEPADPMGLSPAPPER